MIPIGRAISPAPITIVMVPETKGRTPKDFGSNRGSQRVPNKNLKKEPSLKNPADSVVKTKMIPMVVITDKNAERARIE